MVESACTRLCKNLVRPWYILKMGTVFVLEHETLVLYKVPSMCIPERSPMALVGAFHKIHGFYVIKKNKKHTHPKKTENVS